MTYPNKIKTNKMCSQSPPLPLAGSVEVRPAAPPPPFFIEEKVEMFSSTVEMLSSKSGNGQVKSGNV